VISCASPAFMFLIFFMGFSLITVFAAAIVGLWLAR
jgi:hypothetical protein